VNAFLFIVLITSGISLHYSATSSLFLPFNVAIVAHNIAGILLSINFVYYVILNVETGNYRYYLPATKNFVRNMLLQTRYYIWGVFRGEPHPFETSRKEKFNPLQKLTYFGIMFFMMPMIVVTGWLLMFPELAPDEIAGMGGVWPMAVVHAAVGFFLSLFMFGHIYLATHGDTVGSNFKAMFTGWHIHEGHGDEQGPDDQHFDDYDYYQSL
jgi:thiosulfate reductase cytochrome b subunit